MTTRNDDINAKWLAAVYRMDARTAKVSAFAIIAPGRGAVGKVIISHGARTHAVAWLPGDDANTGSLRHHGHANGGGYDKASAAMRGARFATTSGEVCTIQDSGAGWAHEIREAGYDVYQVV